MDDPFRKMILGLATSMLRKELSIMNKSDWNSRVHWDSTKLEVKTALKFLESEVEQWPWFPKFHSWKPYNNWEKLLSHMKVCKLHVTISYAFFMVVCLPGIQCCHLPMPVLWLQCTHISAKILPWNGTLDTIYRDLWQIRITKSSPSKLTIWYRWSKFLHLTSNIDSFSHIL